MPTDAVAVGAGVASWARASVVAGGVAGAGGASATVEARQRVARILLGAHCGEVDISPAPITVPVGIGLSRSRVRAVVGARRLPCARVEGFEERLEAPPEWRSHRKPTTGS